ncbi:hypothetical protein TNCV_397271 [Trichonephila clavipes]|nr:hypothetical protein TNCV_397271 [Trichonephila clavipes]
MITPMILKVFLYLFQYALTLILKNDLLSFREILIFELVLELFERCSPIQSFDRVVPDPILDARPATTASERIPIVRCPEDVRGPGPEGQVRSTARNNLSSNFPQRCRSHDCWPCHRIILCVEDLPGVGSSSHLRSTAHQKICFSESAQTDTSGTVSCCF